MGLLLAKQPVMLRAVVLKNKPPEMLEASPKGTVPILVVEETTVIDESLDIMIWALERNDPQDLLYNSDDEALPKMLELIHRNDKKFKVLLEKYKFAKRYREMSEIYYRRQCEVFIHHLEQRLTAHKFFMGDTPSLADYALLPFVRQFAKVDRRWYLQAPYPNLQAWLIEHLNSRIFSKTMTKYPLWLDTQEAHLFGTDGY